MLQVPRLPSGIAKSRSPWSAAKAAPEFSQRLVRPAAADPKGSRPVASTVTPLVPRRRLQQASAAAPAPTTVAYLDGPPACSPQAPVAAWVRPLRPIRSVAAAAAITPSPPATAAAELLPDRSSATMPVPVGLPATAAVESPSRLSSATTSTGRGPQQGWARMRLQALAAPVLGLQGLVLPTDLQVVPQQVPTQKVTRTAWPPVSSKLVSASSWPPLREVAPLVLKLLAGVYARRLVLAAALHRPAS